jgi:hypothetical protein
MPPIPIKFPISSAPGLRPQEGGGRIVNAFIEKAPDGAPSDVIHRRSPGLERLTIATGSNVQTRGFLDANTVGLWILKDRVIKFDNTFTTADLGALTGTEFVTTARNNNSPADMVVVTNTGCFNLFDSSAPTPFADVDLPASPTSVCDFDGYFVWSYGNGQIYASDLNSVNVNALSFNTEQGLFVRRVVRYAGRLWAFGDKWTGVYRDAGLIPFPFQREVTVPKGIVGTHAVAGWETGWANQLIFAGDDFIVYRLDGYTPVPISTDDVSRDIQEAVLEGDRAIIVAYVYMFENNAFWVVTCQDRFTWEYNLSTGTWNERNSYGLEHWKGIRTIRMFDRWLVGDFATGELYQTSGTYFLEGTDKLIWLVESGTLHSFPRGIVVPRASFHVTSGVGTVELSNDPVIEISWSLDGGYSYGDPVLRKLGGPGQTKSHPYILNCGLSKGQGIRYRLRVSDPVHVGLNGGVIEAEQRGFSG